MMACYRDYPEELHREVKALAAARGVSVTDMMVAIVRRGLEVVKQESRRAKSSR